MAILPNGLDTIELGATAWRDILNRNIEKIDASMGSKRASDISVSTTNFNKNLTSAENTVQKALDKIDDLNLGGALIAETTTFHTFLGENTGSANGTNNVAIGTNVLKNTSGAYNTGVGANTQVSMTSGNNNTSCGGSSLRSMTTGTYNTAVGKLSMDAATTATYNTAVGNDSLKTLSTGSYNIAIGNRAMLYQTIGTYNTAVGVEAGYENDVSTFNANLGYRAGGGTSGVLKNNNVNVGKEAGYNITSKSNQTNIGYQAGKANSFNNITNLGANTSCTRDNQVQLGDSTTTTYCYGRVQNRSDARDKLNITKINNDLAFDFIKMLKPCVYNFNYRENYYDEVEKIDIIEKKEIIQKIEIINEEILNEETQEIEIISKETIVEEEILVKEEVKTTEKVKIENDGSRAGKRFHRGLIAQEVKETADILGFDFAGYQDHSKNGGGDVKSLGYQEFIPFLIASQQKLIEEIELLKEKIKILESK